MASLHVRMSLKYTVPAASRLSEIVAMLHTPAWVTFITSYVVPYLKHSTPAKKAMRLEQIAPLATDGDCTVCMQSLEDGVAVRVACGHIFHEACLAPWLELRSTCPTCRHQFPKEVNGSFAIRGINTAVVLPDALLNTPNVMDAVLDGDTLSTIVHVTLVPLKSQDAKRFPCELNAVVVRSTSSPPSVAEDATMKRSLPEPTQPPIGKRSRSC
ncbi:hypothetical protein SPRG_04404 [Saprolegnia parasitica CBS 223.65]|uniref:RING-type domain-containing protein n=1 Tax=Saprolegnia parasitica (strain CBS 223.65) TaxID=695850 RepID=A0A067CUM6_SAPPC|nr:hypothetical protein SPRG_04404 [Saprolegnia parasitica CBS 223.65]KDO30502.1 hypothetical protein SPRG_04404 [Saprolegnia parasitica CBS 223.65]|eukprot:XP_012198719.1 hypothetical protein SPRG_04404 [Saprolegnia parasitica CBS 223.65]